MKNILSKIILKIKWHFRKNKIVPDISEKREMIEKYRKLFRPDVLVETGTFFGDTVEAFKTKFEQVFSIELSKELAEKANERFAKDKNVKILQGDSSLVLSDLLSEIKRPVLFWLDGHYSSEFFINDVFIQTAKGDINTPVEKELDIIFQWGYEAIILIDDARLFTGEDDYPSIKQIERKVKLYKMASLVIISNDIIQIIPNKK